MKIGLVCMHYTADKGGLERYTLSLGDTLAKRGHEVHVFANTGVKRPGVVLHHVPMFPFSSPGKNLSFAYMASKCAAGFGLDVLQSMERIWRQDIYRASDGINPVQMKIKYPNALHRRIKAAGPRRQVLSLLEKQIYHRGGARFIMVNSRLIKNQIHSYYHVPEDRVVVLYNSVDLQRFNPLVKDRFRVAVRRQYGVRTDERLILFAGHDFQRKGLQLLLEGLAMVGEDKWKLIIASHDPPGRYERWAAANGLGSKVVFAGHQKTLERLYGASDLFILPTRYDAFANACLEAMACGVPVVTTRTNGACEIIENGRDGYVMETHAPGELAGKIRDFLNLSDPSSMAGNAAKKAGRYTVDHYMQQLFELYDRLCGEKDG